MANSRNWRKEIEATFDSFKYLIQKSQQPLNPTPYEPSNESDKHKTGGFLADLQKLGFNDVGTLLSLLGSEATGQQDDNKFLLEHLIQLLAKWGDQSKIGNQLTAGFVNSLWNALPHPPLSSLGTEYKYRAADGSYNNIRVPNLGKANTPYARHARPVILQNVALPDPGVVFDSLMARDDRYEPHPNNISSMLFYLATIITHDIFKTDHSNYNNSMTSSYLDLAPLYGSNQDEQDTVRTFSDGKLKPDCFSEKRILGFPPGVGVMLIMFNRFHNYVVTNLAVINENDRFKKPKDIDPRSAWSKYDNDLFQTGRLITCGLYVNCILKDYVRTILSLNRTDSKWDLDPRTEEGRTLFNTPAAEGVGNQVSAEFNLIYRWHSAVSETDDRWTQQVYAEMFPGKSPEEVTLGELLATLKQFERELSDDPLQRPFANLKRLPDGSLPDDDLVNILEASISDVAGSFGPNRVPKILRSVEILSIMQARSWNLASLNEFREFSGLKKHSTFEDINPDPVIAEKLRNLYDHPDFVELYPGIVAEKVKPPMSPGSGLCVNFTTSYSILSDAVSLVRGDRFYTTDYTPKSLTNWGYQTVQYDTSINEGCVIYKVILHAFPNHFLGNSIYAHFPFVVPAENLAIQTSLNRAEKYSWAKPIRRPHLQVIKSYAAAQNIMRDKTNWKVVSGAGISFLVSQPPKIYGLEFCLSGDEPVNADSRKLIMSSLHPKDWENEVRTFYEQTTLKYLKSYSYEIPGKNIYQVDIVRDISNLVNTRFSASVFCLPVKTEETPHGIYTEQELYQILALQCISVFFSIDVTTNFQVNQAARLLCQQLGELILINCESIAATGLISSILAKFYKPSSLTPYGVHMIQKMLGVKQSIQEVVWTQILPLAAGMTANHSQLFCQSFEYYMGEGSKYIPDLYRLSKVNTKAADEKIMRYFMEGARLGCTISAFRDYKPGDGVPHTVVIQNGDAAISVSAGERILVNFFLSARDPDAFPDPLEVKLDRPLGSYLHYGYGPHQCVGMDVSKIAMTAMFKTVFGLKGLRKAQGSAPGGGWYGESQGEMKKIPSPIGLTTYMTADQGRFFPFPTTMKIQWEAE